MPNRLAGSVSPYLLQHADNPVDWYPWGNEAIEKAYIEDKPVLLSIGYAACHWCHVMAHESFEDPETAYLMNEHFVNIKVDREQRPDLDGIYMQAVVAMTGRGGWPLTVFLTSDLKPFWGGTYFPPVPRFNMPSFRDVLRSIIDVWQNRRDEVVSASGEILRHLRASISMKPAAEINSEQLDRATKALIDKYDWNHGGWGNAPKFPQPMALEFLLKRAIARPSLDEGSDALNLVEHALTAMAKGGMFDVVGGGFSRYSTDNDWLIPHFEKMLYDNALLSQVYLHAFVVTGNSYFRKVCLSTLGFMADELAHPGGGFYSSLDADSEGAEGKYYLWTLEEITATIPDRDELKLFLEMYPVSKTGNFEGKNVLKTAVDGKKLADKWRLPIEDVERRIDASLKKLKAHRSKRVRPGLDDKIVLVWNCLAVMSFFEVCGYLRIDELGVMAIRNIDFLLDTLFVNSSLYRLWRAGETSQEAFLEDYAAFILALLAAYQATFENRYFIAALKITQMMLDQFSDPNGGFFDTTVDHNTPLFRPKELQDNATPSGNALATTALLKMAAYTGNASWYDQAWKSLNNVMDAASRYPLGFSYWLCAMGLATSGLQEVAIVSNNNEADHFIEAFYRSYHPNAVLAVSNLPVPPDAPPLLHDRPCLNDQTTAYICRNFVCKLPVTSVNEFLDQLDDQS